MIGMPLVVVLVTLAPGQQAEPPPLTEEQREGIAQLAKDTQKEAAHLKALLEKRQRELAQVYGRYELDDKRATELEAEVLDLQRQMLANYRKMQVELRAVVDKERFLALKRRLDNFLQSPPEKAPPKETPPGHRP